MQDIPQQGSIADIFIPRLIAGLHRDGFEGSIRVTLGPTTKILYFKRGEIASAASNAETDRLANILIQDGRLTAPQLELARSRMQAGGSLGKILIEMGFLTPAELLQGARRQVRQILASCCTLSSGSYQIDSGPLPAEVTVLGLPTRRVLFDAILQARDRRWIVRQMGSMESVYRPTTDRISGLDALKLDSDLEQIARMVDGAQTLRDLSSHTSMDDFTVSKVVLALEVLGFVELAGVPVPAAPASGRTIAIEDDTGDIPRAHEAAEPFGVQETEGALSNDDAAEGAAEAPPAGEPQTPVATGEPITDVGSSGELYDDGIPLEPVAPDDHPAFEVEPDRSGAEPLAIPGEDLPDHPSPPASQPTWEIDPKTGERIHTGPIELTFDGPTGPPRAGAGDMTRLLVIAVCATFLLAALFVFLVRRDRGGVPSRSAGRVAVARPSPAATSPDVATPVTGDGEQPDAEGQVAGAPDGGETVPGGAPIGAPPAADPGSIAAPVAAGGEEAPATRGADPGPTEHPARQAPPPPPAAAAPRPTPEREPADRQPAPRPATDTGSLAAAPFRDATGYTSALRDLGSGNATRAALAFQELVAAEEPGGFTLQLMIACESETLGKLLSQSEGRGGFYVLPYAYKGRDCYRALWGAYPSLEEARQAIGSLPSSFSTSGLRPIIVSMGRLRPSS